MPFSFGAFKRLSNLHVMCCRCGGFLGIDNRTVYANGLNSGERSILTDGRVIHIPNEELLRSFSFKAECEEEASKAGWSCGKKDGKPNHRCADCHAAEESERERVGHHSGLDAAARVGGFVYV